MCYFKVGFLAHSGQHLPKLCLGRQELASVCTGGRSIVRFHAGHAFDSESRGICVKDQTLLSISSTSKRWCFFMLNSVNIFQSHNRLRSRANINFSVLKSFRPCFVFSVLLDREVC